MKNGQLFFCVILIFLVYPTRSFAQNNLAAGDLAIASYQSDFDASNPIVGDNNLAEIEDRFSVVITKQGGLAGSTVIFFTTRGWNAVSNNWHDLDFPPNTFGLGRRAVVRWTVPAGGIAQGTEVFFFNLYHDEAPVGQEYYDWGAYADYNGTTALGVVANVTPILPAANSTDGMSFSFSGDHLLVYQTGPVAGPNAGPNGTPIRFITALMANNNGTTTFANWDPTPAAVNAESSVPPGLTNGQTCFLMSPGPLPAASNGTNEPDNGKFSACALSAAGTCTALQMAAIIYNINNWTFSNSVFALGTSSSLCVYNILPNNTVTLSSAPGTNAQTKCINTAITPITYNTTGATGATVTGLPVGVNGSWASNVVTITGIPTVVGGALTYTVTLTGGCGTITTTGTITVIAGASITSNPSANTACSGLAVSFTGAASNQTSLAWQESADIGFTTPTTLTNTGIYSNTSTATLNISDNSGLSGRYYRLVGINSNGCPNANSTGALLTATAPTLPGTTSATNTIGTNNNLSYAASCGIVSKVVPLAGTPVSGIVTSNVWVEAAVPTSGGKPFVQRHYQITPAAGSTATVTLYFSQTEFNNFNAVSLVDLPTSSSDAAGKANMRISKFNGSSSGGGLPGSYSSGASLIDPVDANIIFNAALNRWEVSFDVSGFSGFFVQTSTSILPVNLISFSAQKTSNDIQLKWQTSSETNNDHFELERSLDGRTFATIGQRTANNGTGINNYDWLDVAAVSLRASKIFYRLKIVSTVGSVDYSNTVVVLNKAEVGITDVMPNPFTDQLNINLNMPKRGNLIVKLTDMSGRILRKENTQVPKGFSTYSMTRMENIAAGIYFISIELEGETYKYKVVK